MFGYRGRLALASVITLKFSMQIVPGYYLRRNTDGFIEHSTCVNNTASEHYMVERMIIDDMLNWAGNYKVVICSAMPFCFYTP